MYNPNATPTGYPMGPGSPVMQPTGVSPYGMPTLGYTTTMMGYSSQPMGYQPGMGAMMFPTMAPSFYPSPMMPTPTPTSNPTGHQGGGQQPLPDLSQPMINYPPQEPLLNVAPSPTNQKDQRPTPVPLKKGRMYVTIGNAASVSYHCVLTSDGTLSFYPSENEKTSSRPQDTFVIGPKDQIKLEGGNLSITREDGEAIVLNAISSNLLKEWLDAIRDLQKDLRALARLSPATSLSPVPPRPQLHNRRSSADKDKSSSVNVDYDSIPVPPRPRVHGTTGRAGTLNRHSSSSERSSSPSSSPTTRSPLQALTKEESFAEVRRHSDPTGGGGGATVVPPPKRPDKGRLKRSSSVSGAAAEQIKLESNTQQRHNSADALPSPRVSEDAASEAGNSSSSEKEEGERKVKTQGGVRKPLPSLPGQSVEALMNEIKILKQKNEQLEKAAMAMLQERNHAVEGQSNRGNLITIDLKKDAVEYHERLGGGGSGATVFRCSVKGFSFAAKILSTQYHQPEEIEPLLREISIMTRLQHDNIVRFIGSEVNCSEIRLFMELYSGTLRDVIDSYVAQQRTFPKKEVVNYLFQITKGLNYLHTQDPPVVHRDLKSDNIFVTWDGQKNPKNLRIGDFDVSKIMTTGKMSFTQNIGTPGFIAPEIFTKAQPAKHADVGHGIPADIWSLGMIMFELITLKRPYFDMPFLQVSEANANGQRPNIPDDVNKDDFKDVLKLFEKCTRKLPSKRPTAKRLLGYLGQM